MGRELTKRHSLLFERKLPNPAAFLRDIYKYGKARELMSFVVWELLHRLRLFPRAQYLAFSDEKGVSLENQSLADPVFRGQLATLFGSRGLGLVAADHNWKLRFNAPNQGGIFGCQYPDDRDLYAAPDAAQSPRLLYRFPDAIKSIFVSSRNTVFVCVRGGLYRSSDGGRSFKKAFDFASPESFFRHNNAMAETAGHTLVVGEYGNVWQKSGWRPLAYLYLSADDGETWQKTDFLIRLGANKHVHLVMYSGSLRKLFVADGDNRKRLWVSDHLHASDLVDPRNWKLINKFHIQMGGYTSVAETDKSILFGTDYQGGTNFVVETTDGLVYRKRIVPDPYRRSPIDNMVQRRSSQGHEVWANLPYSAPGTRCLLMHTRDNGKRWTRLIEYSRATHKVWLISSGSEVGTDLYFSIDDIRRGERAVYRVADA